MNSTTEIPADLMRDYQIAFGAECMELARDLAAQGDTDAQELLEKIEGQAQGVAA